MISYPAFEGLVYRACSMEYYRAAYGGKGSRLMAGRFNPKGEVALYVAMDVQTAYAEFQRSGIGRPQPCSIIAARLRVRNMVDLTGDLSSCHADLQNWQDDWEDARDALNAGDLTPSRPSVARSGRSTSMPIRRSRPGSAGWRRVRASKRRRGPLEPVKRLAAWSWRVSATA